MTIFEESYSKCFKARYYYRPRRGAPDTFRLVSVTSIEERSGGFTRPTRKRHYDSLPGTYLEAALSDHTNSAVRRMRRF